MISTPVNPFYDSGSAPPPIPPLSTQTPMIYNHHRVSMVANEELRPSLPKTTTAPLNSTSAPVKSGASTPDPPASRSGNDTPRHATPLHPPPRAYRASELKANSRDATPSPSERTALSDSEESVDPDASVQRLIPKPPGGPGRPDSGGYNLAIAMELSPSAFKKLKVDTIHHNTGLEQLCLTILFQHRAHRVIKRHLDLTKNYRQQGESAKRSVREEVCVRITAISPIATISSFSMTTLILGDIVTAGPSMTLCRHD
jgi:hypothetical protein